MRLQGKAALITGGGAGLGRAAALRFAREGAMVTVADYNKSAGQESVELILEQKGKAIFVHGDVSNATDCEKMVQTTVDAFGRIDILYNNAGIDIHAPVVEMSEKDWNQIIDIHLKGTFLMSKFAIPHMQRQGGGSIINTSSVGGIVGLPTKAAYCSAKAGIINLTKVLAIEHGKDNIRVNVIAPGAIDTPMVQRYFAEVPDGEAVRNLIVSYYPIGRLGKPEEVANMALFLASDESSFCTGALFSIDGGYTARGPEV